jgi:hypothetical protein
LRAFVVSVLGYVNRAVEQLIQPDASVAFLSCLSLQMLAGCFMLGAG